MTLQNDLDNPAIEKHPLVILKPRVRVTGWTIHALDVYVADFSAGPVSRVWANYDRTDGLAPSPDVASIGADSYYYDAANGKLYAYVNGVDPDDAGFMDLYYDTIPGLTVEYELYLAVTAIRGPRDPLDPDSDPVDWLGVLRESPQAALGSKQLLFGFQPLEETNLLINNQDGWMQPHLYDRSYSLCVIRSFIMAGSDLERAASLGYVKETYTGYGGAPQSDTEGAVSIPCYDFLAMLERPANPPQRMSTAEFPGAEPESTKLGREWFIRRVRGMVDNHEPVNIDYDATPGTAVNRDFLTHEGTGTDGTVGHTVDHLAANTATQTFFLTTPLYNVGDSVIIQRNGVAQYTIISSVNRAAKWVTHNTISATVASGDSSTRYYIGWVKVRDSDGNWWNLFASKHFSRINKATLGNNPDWLGFRLIDNWEGDVGFPETFDPARHRVVCRVYGTAVLDTYESTDPVGAIVDDGGTAAQAVSLLHYLLREAGIPNSMIDQTTFENATTNHALGIAIPGARDDQAAPTYKELVRLVLVSMIWKLIYIESSGEIKIGLVETGPFVAAADYEVDDLDFRDFEFQHDYSAIYHRFELEYAAKEVVRDGDGDIFYGALAIFVPDGTQLAVAENRLARDLHMSEDVFEEEILQYLIAEAQVIADRYAFALGDRRAYYQLVLGPGFLEKANLGASYQVKRKQLPGFEFDADVNRERQTMLIESTKSAKSVNLTLEDQKGIQDNAGDW